MLVYGPGGDGERIEVGDAADLPALLAALDAAPGRVILDIRNAPGDATFDAPYCATARAVAAVLAGRSDDVVVASADWFSIEVARDAGLATAFVTPAGIALDAAAAYAAEAGHAECHPHADAVLDAPEAVAEAQRRGCAVVARGAADDETVRRLRAAGVDGVVLERG